MAIANKDSIEDVERSYDAVRHIEEAAHSTYTDGVLDNVGSFGGFFKIPKKVKRPVLVSRTAGVGTKLKYAVVADRHDTVGIDAVAMCVNDIVCHGAKPLFYLDYFTTGSLGSEKVIEVVSGIATGCKQAGVALIGGKTAEMPGFCPKGEYNLAGVAVGIVDKKKIINGKRIRRGDVLIGIKSNGLHANGYSLVRKIFGENILVLNKYDEVLDKKIINQLLIPTKIYVNSILSLIQKVKVYGIAHITGGGLVENIPHILPEGLGCEIKKNSYEVPAIFKIIQERSGISDEEMYSTFNMGIGMVVCVEADDVDKTIQQLQTTGEECVVLGKVVKGRGVKLV